MVSGRKTRRERHGAGHVGEEVSVMMTYLCVIPCKVATEGDVETVSIVGIWIALENFCSIFKDDCKAARLPAKVARFHRTWFDRATSHVKGGVEGVGGLAERERCACRMCTVRR